MHTCAGGGQTVAVTRLRHIDVLRGVAILGILPVNIIGFALPTPAFGNTDIGPGGGFLDQLAGLATIGLFEEKFISIFSFLFGVGMALMWERSEAKGNTGSDRFEPIMVRRLLILWGLGILHAVLLWYGDVVSVYAPLGLVLFWFARSKPNGLLATAAVLLALAVPGLLGLGALASWSEHVERRADTHVLENRSPAPHRDVSRAPEATGMRLARQATNAIVSQDLAFEEAVFRHGSFGQISVVRTLLWMAIFFWGFMPYFIFRVAAMFLIGMGCVRAGWLARPREEPGPLRRMLTVGLLIGVPLQVLRLLAYEPASTGLRDAFEELLQFGASLGLAAAYVGGTCLLVARTPSARWVEPLEAVGRTAFTNYVAQSVICTTLFYSYGFGLYGRFDRAALLGMAIVIWGAQLAVSTWWMRRFTIGPIEWAWRSITYLTWMPLRRPTA